MKKYFIQLITLLACMYCEAVLAIPFLYLSPSSQHAKMNEAVTIDIFITRLKEDNPSIVLGAFDLTIHYDYEYLTLPSLTTSVQFGAGLGNLAAGEAIGAAVYPVPGVLRPFEVRLFEVSLLEADPAHCVFCQAPYLSDLQSDTFKLATLSFQWSGNTRYGYTQVSFENAVLSDSLGNPIQISGLLPAVVFVPEPPTIALMGLALLMLIGYRILPKRAPHIALRKGPAVLALCMFALGGNSAAQNVTSSSRFLLAATARPTLDLFLIQDNGAIAPPIAVGDLSDGAKLAAMAIADFDGDGKPDFIASSNENPSRLFLYRRTDATGFVATAIGALDPDPKAAYWLSRSRPELAFDYGLRLIAADLNNDGAIDFIECINQDFGDGKFWIAKGNAWLNDGQGHFTKHSNAFDFSAISTGWTLGMSSTLGDVNGDGIPDMVVSEQASGTDVPSRIFLLQGMGDGSFSAPRHLLTAPHPATFISLGDVNNDGRVDLLLGMDDDGDPGQVYLFFGLGNGAFGQEMHEAFDTRPDIEWFNTDSPGGGKFQLTDIDQDGVLDIVASPATIGPSNDAVLVPAHLQYFHGVGGGKFGGTAQLIQDLILSNIGFTAPLAAASILPSPQEADIDQNGQVDSADLQFLLGTPRRALGPNDPWDLNHDGIINVLDARKLVLLCTFARCATR